MSKKLATKSADNQTTPKYDFFNQLLVVVIAATLTTFPFIFDSFTVSKILSLAIGLTYLSIKFLYVKGLHGVNRLPRTLTFLVVMFLSSLIMSWSQSDVPLLRGLFGQFGRGNGLFYYFFVILIFIYAVKTFKVNSSLKMHQLITWLSWFMAVYATLQRIGIDIAKLDTRELSPVVLTFGNSNFAGAILSVLFAYQFTFTVLRKSFHLSQIALICMLILSTSFTAAVQGYLIIFFVILVGMSIFMSQKFKSLWLKRGILFIWCLGLIGILLGVFGKFVFAGIFSRTTFQARIEYWKITLQIIKDYPVFGIGPDKLFDITGSYMSPGSLKIITATRMDNAHNWYLNLGANYGLISLFFLMLLLGYVFYRMIFLFRNLTDSNPIPLSASVAFMAMFIDGLVSLEQPGLGIWMYIFAGVTVAASLENDASKNGISTKNELGEKDPLVKLRSLVAFPLLFLIASCFVIGNRVIVDGYLRSNVQSALVNKGTVQTFLNIESAAIKLRSEPEYSVQAAKPLAAIGDGVKLDSVSKAIYEYYPTSIHATLIRADVLRALNRENESCPLRSLLIRNTPWDIDQFGKYIDCSLIGHAFWDIKDTLTLAIQFVPEVDESDIPSNSDEIRNVYSQLNLVSLRARATFILGEIKSARELQVYGNKLLLLLDELKVSNSAAVSEQQIDNLKRRLNF